MHDDLFFILSLVLCSVGEPVAMGEAVAGRMSDLEGDGGISLNCVPPDM